MAWRSVGIRSDVPLGGLICGGAFVIVLVVAVAVAVVSIVLAFTCVNECMITG